MTSSLLRVRGYVTLAALLLALLHVIFPSAAIDTVFLVLLAVAALPWIAPLLESVEFPGGFKLKLREIAEKAERAGLLAAPPRQEVPGAILESIAKQDPNLALVGLRIELEKRLRTLADRAGLETERLGLAALLRRLGEKEVLSQAERSVFLDMTVLLNSAAHGHKIHDNDSTWALDTGFRLLGNLDARIAQAEENLT